MVRPNIGLPISNGFQNFGQMRKRGIFWIFCFFVISVFSQTEERMGITICWDNSLSMSHRDLEKDFSILDKIFERNKNQQVQILFFNSAIDEREYKVQNGNWEALRADILAVNYDGASIYSELEARIKYNSVYIFTDGSPVFLNDVLSLPPKSLIVNSNPIRNADFLKRTALITRSRLMDFAAMQPKKLSGLKNTDSEQEQSINGKVYIGNTPTSNVKVTVKGSADNYLTDADGNFSIPAKIGDSIQVSSRANNTLKVIPITEISEMNIFLEGNIVALEEVILFEKRQEEQITTTGYGKENKEKIGYAVQSIGDDEISPIQTNVAQSIQNRFSGVNAGSSNDFDISQVTIRTNTSILSNNYGLVVIDGVPQQQSDSSTGGRANALADFSSLDPGIIADITVLKGLAATNRYGSLGANGVILITTKNAVYGKNKEEKRDLARIKNNVYNDEKLNVDSQDSPTLKALKNAKSDKEAYGAYISLAAFQRNNTNFYLEAFDFFKESKPELAIRIISNLLENNPKDLTTLKTVALSLSSIGAHKEALKVYRQIIELYPDHVQSYLDMALAKKESGKYQEALNELLALSNGTLDRPLKTKGISKSLNREIGNLVLKHKNVVNSANVPSKFQNNLTLDVRLIFEWNDPEKEFEIQFVNPQKRFFTWEHTVNANPDRIQKGIKNGFTSEEFEFYGANVKGKWIINAKYIGSLSSGNDNPFLLKCSLYQNYGRPNETKKELLILFNDPDQKKNIYTLSVN